MDALVQMNGKFCSWFRNKFLRIAMELVPQIKPLRHGRRGFIYFCGAKGNYILNNSKGACPWAFNSALAASSWGLLEMTETPLSSSATLK